MYAKGHNPHTLTLLLLCIFSIFIGFTTAHGGEPHAPKKIEGIFKEKEEGGFTASWVIYEGLINFTVTAPVAGWVGIGFSHPNVLDWTDFIVGNSTSVSDMFIGFGNVSAQNDEDRNGKNNILDSKVTNEKTSTSMFFSRKLDTEDKFADHMIVNADLILTWAYGNNADDVGKLANSTLFGHSKLNFYSIEDDDDGEMLLIRYHGVLMCLFIMIFMTAAIITSRYLKHVLHWWFYLHAALSLVGFIIMCVSLSIVFKAHGNKLVPSWHSAFGIIFIIFISLQMLIGFYSHFKFDKFRREIPVFPDKIHWWLGRVIYFLGLLNITIGLSMLGTFSGLGWFFYVSWCVSVVITVVFLQRSIGQTHETAGGHTRLEGAEETAEDKEHGGGAKTLSKQRKNKEFMVMFFVPAITAIFTAWMGIVLLI